MSLHIGVKSKVYKVIFLALMSEQLLYETQHFYIIGNLSCIIAEKDMCRTERKSAQ